MHKCQPTQHRYFYAECIAIEADGKVVPIAICTACGDVLAPEILVSTPGAPMRLLKAESKQTTN